MTGDVRRLTFAATAVELIKELLFSATTSVPFSKTEIEFDPVSNATLSKCVVEIIGLY